MKRITISDGKRVTSDGNRGRFCSLFPVSCSPRLAFTLAETLITLGIISVVAAICIPALNNAIQDRQFKEAAKKAFSVSSQAVEQMRQDNGGSLSNYYTTAGSFKTDFVKYFNVLQDCGLHGCVPAIPTSDVYTSLAGDKANTSYMYYGQFVTADGMFFGIYTNGEIVISVDVNGYQKGPNVYGKDVFFFQLVNDNLVPVGANGTVYYDSNNSYCNKANHDSIQGLGCMTLIMQGINY